MADLGSVSAQQALAALGPADSPGVALYFIGVGERLEDLETFNAQEFAQALVA